MNKFSLDSTASNSTISQADSTTPIFSAQKALSRADTLSKLNTTLATVRLGYSTARAYLNKDEISEAQGAIKQLENDIAKFESLQSRLTSLFNADKAALAAASERANEARRTIKSLSETSSERRKAEEAEKKEIDRLAKLKRDMEMARANEELERHAAHAAATSVTASKQMHKRTESAMSRNSSKGDHGAQSAASSAFKLR